MKDIDRKDFGYRLRRLRKAKKLVAKDVAKVIGVSESTIIGYENGNRMPDINILNKLAQFFDVSTDYLLNATEKKMNDLANIFKLGHLTYNGIPLSEEEIRKVEEYLRFIIHDKLFPSHAHIPSSEDVASHVHRP